MIPEPFAIGNSWIHRIDPRVRIVFAAIYSFVVALSSRFPVLLTALAVSISLVCLARLNPREVGKRLLAVFCFLLLIWAVLPLTFEGEALYHAGPLTITLPGVILSAQITLKATAILLIFMVLIATMTIATLGNSLNRLRLPGKLVHLLLMTYRYIFVIEEEYRRLRTAVKIRGFRSGTNIHSYKTYAYLIGMLFVRASVRAECVHQAMRCRGFKGKFYTLDDFTSTGQNRLFSVLMAAVIICLIILEYY
jgi:cobalt/nickel transport system permease protein